MLYVLRQRVNFTGGGSMQSSIQAVPSCGVCDNGWLCSETVPVISRFLKHSWPIGTPFHNSTLV